MNDMNSGAAKAPRPVIEQGEPDDTRQPEGPRQESFHDATVGFFQGVGRRAWAYADAHPHAVLYGLVGFVLAVLILVIGLWDTIVITVFSGVGILLGHMVDSRGGAAGMLGKIFGGHQR